MRPEVIGELINGAIPLLLGIYISLLGFRIVGKKPGESPKYDAWYDRYGRFFKIGGPFLILFGLFLAISGIARVS